MNKKEGIKLCESELKVMELLWEEGELRAGEMFRFCQRALAGTAIRLIQLLKSVWKRVP